MHKFQYYFVSILLPLISNPALSATEFEENVPVELAKIILGNVRSPDVKIYSDILDEFPVIDFSNEFSVLGSVDQGYSYGVYLETSLPFSTAKSSIFDPLIAEGWVEIVAYLQNAPQTGFVNSNLPEVTTNSICHDDFGSMNFRFSQRDSTNLISLTITNTNNFSVGIQPTCAQRNERQAMVSNPRAMMNSGVRQYMPRLELPEQIALAVPNLRGISGSDMDAYTEISIPIEWSMDELYQYFSEQLIAQGWEFDSDWSGSITSGGNWTHSPAENINLVGVLSIIKFAENNFQMKFRLLDLGAGRQTGRGWFSP